MKLELELDRAGIGRSLNPMLTFFTYRGDDAHLPTNQEHVIVLLQKAQFQKHGEPARIRVTIEWDERVMVGDG